jgi:hypothetical protein
MREEIVSNEETHENPIIKGSLKVILETSLGRLHLDSKILAKDIGMQPNVGFRRMLRGSPFFGSFLFGKLLPVIGKLTIVANVTFSSTSCADLVLTGVEEDVFSEDSEVRFVGCKTQHDQVSV